MKYNILKKVTVAIIFNIIIFNFYSQILAFSELEYKELDNGITRLFNVTKNEENQFLDFIKLDFINGDKTYHFSDYTKKDDINLNKTEEYLLKKSNLDTNNPDKIKEIFGNTYIFDDGEYKGILEISNIEFNSIYQGKHQEILEYKETVKNVNENELNNVPKLITRQGYNYVLVDIDFDIIDTTQIDNNYVPLTYNYTAIYQTVIEVDNPYKYDCIITYSGIVEKVNPSYMYEVNYNIEIPEVKQEKDFNIKPVIIIFIAIFIPIFYYLFRYNVKVYNNINGKYKLIGKYRISKNNLVLTLDSKKHKFSTNLFNIKINNRCFKKYKNQIFKVYLNNKYKNIQIKSNNIDFRL